MTGKVITIENVRRRPFYYVMYYFYTTANKIEFAANQIRATARVTTASAIKGFAKSTVDIRSACTGRSLLCLDVVRF